MPSLSNRIQNLKPSPTVQMGVKARELEMQGNHIIKLNYGEPDFKTPFPICDAAKKGIQEGYFFYTPVPGYLELREAICNKLKRDNQLDYSPDQIVVSCGAKHSIANAIMATVNEGDEVIILAPYWVSYPEQVRLAGGTPVYVHADITTQFKPNIEDIEKAITPKTKAILYSSPSNPTGAILSQKDIEELADIVRKHDIYVISDEIYEYLNFTGNPHASIAQFEDLREKVILVNGFSKSYAMTGWRLGYMAAPLPIAKGVSKMQGQVTSGASSIAQRAAITAANMLPSELVHMKDTFRKRRDKVVQRLSQVEGMEVDVPEGTFYVFPDISGVLGKRYGDKVINSSLDLAMYLLEEQKIAVVAGEGFGAPNNLRISFAASEEDLDKGISAIVEGIAKLS